MSNPFDRLLQFAEKVEKNAPIVFTKEEEKLIEEIQAQQSVLTKLQEEFQAASIEDGSTWTSFRFETKEEDQDNMSIELLAELLRSEDEGNQDIIKACREHVVNTAASMVQRTFRGHIGRRMTRLMMEQARIRKAERSALKLQAAYRGMRGRKAANRTFADVAEEEIRQGASVLIQRMYRGAKQRTMMRNILQEVRETDRKFFSSGGESELSIYYKRNAKGHAHLQDSDDSESDSEDDGFLNTRHPATGKILKNAPQYGKAINETRRQHHYPRTRRVDSDSHDSSSS